DPSDPLPLVAFVQELIGIRMSCRSASEAKRLGRTLTRRPGWDARPGQEPLKVEVMRGLLKVKFRADSVLAEQLLATGNAQLIEGTTWRDVFWGCAEGSG
ncbi:NADAR family protein, partial [Deinococcus ruber]|uniref:NADAR family protein n=1 Tax=Deinococcus ruber TaxID=1848197 RepID=UPI001E543DC1